MCHHPLSQAHIHGSSKHGFFFKFVLFWKVRTDWRKQWSIPAVIVGWPRGLIYVHTYANWTNKLCCSQRIFYNTFIVAALKIFKGALVNAKISFSSNPGFIWMSDAVIFQIISWNSLQALAKTFSFLVDLIVPNFRPGFSSSTSYWASLAFLALSSNWLPKEKNTSLANSEWSMVGKATSL